MIQAIKDKIHAVRVWITNSWHIETIFWARVKLFVGMTFTAIQQSGVDIAGFVDNTKAQMAVRVAFAWLIVDGTITEWARRRNATDLTPAPAPDLAPPPPKPL